MLDDTNIDYTKITLGKESEFKDERTKKIIPILYNDNKLTFSSPNNYFEITKIREDNYNTKYIVIKSIKITQILNNIINVLPKEYNVNKFSEFINLFFYKNTDFDFNYVGENSFKACIAIDVVSIFINNDIADINLKINDMIVTEVNKNLKVDTSEFESNKMDDYGNITIYNKYFKDADISVIKYSPIE